MTGPRREKPTPPRKPPARPAEVEADDEQESAADEYERMMRRRRWKRRIIALLLVLILAVIGLAALLPTTRYGFMGLVRGERFFRGKPTSYWRRELVRAATPDRPPTAMDRLLQNLEKRLGLNPNPAPTPDAPLKEGDAAAASVLADLLADKEAAVRLPACQALTTIAERARTEGNQADVLRPAVPALVKLLRDGTKQDHYYVTATLAAAGPAAEEAAPILAKYLQAERSDIFRTAYARALLFIAPENPAALPKLLTSLTSSEPTVRDEATTILTHFVEARGESGLALLRARKAEIGPALHECEQKETKDSFGASATAQRCKLLIKQIVGGPAP